MATIAAGGDIVEAEDVNYPDAAQGLSGDNATGVVPTGTAQNGSTVCGVAFVAPRSGRVMVSCQVTIQVVTGGSGQMFMGPQVRSGSTVGSGTVVYDPNTDPGCKFGSSLAQLMAGSCVAMVDGLTPGASYNVCATYFGVGLGGSPTMSYFSRAVTVWPAD